MKPIPNTPVSILIPDAEWEVLTNHVKHCFSEIKEVNLYVMSCKRYMPSRFSRYISHYTYVPAATDAISWIKAINQEVERYGIDIILPVYEEAIERLIQYKHRLSHPDKLVLLPELEAYRVANNKRHLSVHMRKNGIPHPKSFQLSYDQTVTLGEETFPILAKPESNAEGGVGIQLLDTRSGLQKYIEENSGNTGIIYQEYIEGYDIDCSVLCREGDVKAYTIQRGTLGGQTPFAPPSGLVFTEAPKLLEIIKNLMRTLNWSGVAHIDCRFDRHRNQYLVLEINPRYWYSLDGSLMAGVNFPWLHVILTQGLEVLPNSFREIDHLSLKGLWKTIRRDPLVLFRFGYLKHHTSLRYEIKDPLPVLVKLLYRIRNKTRRIFKNSRRS